MSKVLMGLNRNLVNRLLLDIFTKRFEISGNKKYALIISIEEKTLKEDESSINLLIETRNFNSIEIIFHETVISSEFLFLRKLELALRRDMLKDQS